jgi:N-acetylmuramic acid 6-phosphate etherase
VNKKNSSNQDSSNQDSSNQDSSNQDSSSRDLFKQISKLASEQINPATENIDSASLSETLRMINEQDKLVAFAVEQVLPDIEIACQRIIHAFKTGGRLIYIGAGTSGRLGILDAAECPPTFGSDPNLVEAIIAGGSEAVFQAQEGAEDSREAGVLALKEKNITSNDIICGLAASGRTPFVRGALSYASSISCFTIIISTVPKTQLFDLKMNADCMICPDVGPEVIMGSTRMKSATAQKMILNMLTTATFVKMGKTYNNVMVDLQMTNKKLIERAKRIIILVTNCNYDEASLVLEKADNHVKTAIVMRKLSCDKNTAKELLQKNDGFIKAAIT